MSDRYKRILKQIHAGVPVLIDGATGTEVERRGVRKIDNAWNAGGVLSDPEVVQEIHEDYIRCGARIIISNTFATHKSALQEAGEGEHFHAYNRRSVELACAARDELAAEHVLVAGGLSHWSFTGRKPPLEALRDDAKEQAHIMADAGAELLLLEMMSEIDRLLAVLDGAKSAGLPIWPGLSCQLDEHSIPILLDGEPLAEAVRALRDKDVDLINIMHTNVEHVSACLDVLVQGWHGPVGVYAHSGKYNDNLDLDFDTVISEQSYCDYVHDWLARSVVLVGGCCGIGPTHMRKLADSGSFSGVG